MRIGLPTIRLGMPRVHGCRRKIMNDYRNEQMAFTFTQDDHTDAEKAKLISELANTQISRQGFLPEFGSDEGYQNGGMPIRIRYAKFPKCGVFILIGKYGASCVTSPAK